MKLLKKNTSSIIINTMACFIIIVVLIGLYKWYNRSISGFYSDGSLRTYIQQIKDINTFAYSYNANRTVSEISFIIHLMFKTKYLDVIRNKHFKIAGPIEIYSVDSGLQTWDANFGNRGPTNRGVEIKNDLEKTKFDFIKNYKILLVTFSDNVTVTDEYNYQNRLIFTKKYQTMDFGAIEIPIITCILYKDDKSYKPVFIVKFKMYTEHMKASYYYPKLEVIEMHKISLVDIQKSSTGFFLTYDRLFMDSGTKYKKDSEGKSINPEEDASIIVNNKYYSNMHTIRETLHMENYKYNTSEDDFYDTISNFLLETPRTTNRFDLETKFQEIDKQAIDNLKKQVNNIDTSKIAEIDKLQNSIDKQSATLKEFEQSAEIIPILKDELQEIQSQIGDMEYVDPNQLHTNLQKNLKGLKKERKSLKTKNERLKQNITKLEKEIDTIFNQVNGFSYNENRNEIN